MDCNYNSPAHNVAPLAGAWIEILLVGNGLTQGLTSLPLRERGLKFECGIKAEYGNKVAPLAVAWIEIDIYIEESNTIMSLPLRERGLKYLCALQIQTGTLSLPLRERGLK